MRADALRALPGSFKKIRGRRAVHRAHPDMHRTKKVCHSVFRAALDGILRVQVH